jgi:predicted acetyltransferase
MVTCDDDNQASMRVILNNGGKLASRGPHPLAPNKTMLRFWIETGPR